MSSISRGASKFVTSLVLAAGLAGFASVGCGPSPAYYDEPRTPTAWESAPPGVSTAEPEPMSSEQLAQQEAQQPQQRPPVEISSVDSQPIQPQAADVNVGANTDEYSDTDPSALTDFRSTLDPHGTWVDDPTYGTLWVPSQAEVGSDFQPYETAGHWTYSDADSWVWVSDYDWGWVPFHYGRWVLLPGHGWSWIPGRTYAGAWVVWRTGPYGYDYVGWAPAPPDWYWWNGYAIGWSFGWYHPNYYYCSRDYIYSPHMHGHVVYGGTPAAAPIEARTAPYRPAQPGVGGAPAGGRVIARPGVGGAAGRQTAQPGVGPRVPGPRPGDLGIKQASIVPPPTNNSRLARAQAFATPATARPLGASAPAAQFRPRRIEPDAMAGAPSRGIGMTNPSPSVSSRLDAVARSPQVQGVAPTPVPSPPRSSSTSSMRDSNPFAGRVMQTPPSVSGSAPSAPRTPPLVERWNRPVPSTGMTSPSAPTYRNAPTVHAQPSVPAYRSPTVSSAPYHSSAPTFRSAPSIHSTPSVTTVRPSVSSPSRSAPSVRSSGGRGGRR